MLVVAKPIVFWQCVPRLILMSSQTLWQEGNFTCCRLGHLGGAAGGDADFGSDFKLSLPWLSLDFFSNGFIGKLILVRDGF